ncbi:uncharacterized protein LOC104652133 isoform X2 [Saimiri boliviensis]|uniref:uncharacterized protein LOC104652133 isoform X2 n=1 Tax=Saimiri boliviensis TaxID=27679 RepID=UPI003D771304
MEVPAVQIQKRRSLGRGGPWGAEGKVPSMGAGPCVSAGACHACCCAHQPCLDLWPTWLSSSPPGGCPHPTATSVVPVLVLAWAAARKEKQEINHRILSSAGNQRRTPFILQTCRVDPSRTSSPPPGLQPLRQVLVPPP